MRLSLQARVSIFVTLTIVAISSVSTYLFTSAHSRNAERGLVARGTALNYSLSKAAEEGLIHENLDLIKKASNIIKAPDVTLAQVYSDIWEAIDAYPFERLKELPHPEAVRHFSRDSSHLSIKVDNGYDFYSPILFKASEDSPSVSIGFVRIRLSSSSIQKELRNIVVTNVIVSVIITLLAIALINILIRGLVVKPVMALYKSVSMFKNGVLPDDGSSPRQSSDEIRELSQEFTRMCRTIAEKEQRLVESERRIKSLFDRVEHAIFRLNRNGAIVDTNPRFKEMFGDVTGLCDILIAEKEVVDCLQRAVSSKFLQREERVLGKDGDERTVLVSLYSEIDENGNITGFDGYLIDMTEKKRLEERLLRAQKLEAVGTLAGGMAHEFNNLLAAILGYAEIMLDSTKEGEPFYKPAKIIHSAAERGADLSKKILTVTRKEKMETRRVNINEIVKGAVELLRSSIPKNVEIAVNLREDIPMITADPSQIQQVILNLAVNARDAMSDGGRLIVETESIEDSNGLVRNLAGGKSGFVKLSVSDTGTGMDSDLQSKIFNPFFTTKETGKGTGLGLYIVHSIVNNHGGYINLYSEPGRGTRFNIYLPVAKSGDGEMFNERQDLSGSETILVIDDEVYVREMCRDILTPLGYEVTVAGGGSEGINIFSEMKDRIALVILDMIMPKMGGNEVFGVLKTMKPDVKVLLCSGYSSNGFAGIDRLLKSGAAGFIQKPFSRQDIALAIKKALSG